MSSAKLLLALETFRNLDEDIPLRVMSTFLIIAGEPGIRLTDIANKLDTPLSSASRHVFQLSKWFSPKKPGLNLVETRPDEQDRRAMRAYLTDKGEKLKDEILA